MKIKVLGPISSNEDGSWLAQFEYGAHDLDAGYDPRADEPQVIRVRTSEPDEGPTFPWTVDPEDQNNVWAYHGYSVLVKNDRRSITKIRVTPELIVEIKGAVIKYEKRIGRLRRVVDTESHASASDSAKSCRERIPDAVRIFVWQRDKGRCVQCGSQEKLEFDHIIPVSKGGSYTERNIQLLCETCNRSKGADI